MKEKALKYIIAIATLLGSTAMHGQNTYRLHGKVEDASGAPIEMAVVSLNKSIWVTTDRTGAYEFTSLKPGRYEYLVSFLGYQDAGGTISINADRSLNITLRTLSLELNTVTVTAEREDMGSKSIINEEAIKHLQPKSMSDLLQLVPGNLAKNPNLNELSQATVREIDPTNGSSLGTSVVIDGAPVSNDANLQAIASTRYGTASSTQTDGMSDQTTAGGGTDLRTISAGIVESMEVISGIPGAEYGNLTSGVVIVKTKAGRTPWEFKAQADPNSKLLYIGKGFGLKKGGSVNLSADWSQSFSDPRRRYLGYDRITAAAGFSKVWNKASLNVKGSFYSNVNERKQDPQLEELDIAFTNKNIGGRLSAFGNINPGVAWITGIDYNLSAQVSRTEDIHITRVLSPDGAITNVMEEGLHRAAQKIRPYYSEYHMHGVPINIFGQISANKYFQIGEKDYNRIKIGVEYTLDANRGNGLTYDFDTPPQNSSSHTLRPRAYKDIPALNTVTAFVSDKGRFSLGSLALKEELGLRASNLNGYSVLEPRANLSLSILNTDNNSFFEDLSLNGGYGISNKMPTLLYLYPEPSYYDFVCLNRYNVTTDSGFAVISTNIVQDTHNPNLKPATAIKKEIGLSWSARGISGFATFFHENHSNEFGYETQLFWGRFPRFTIPDGAQDLALEGNSVTYTLNGVRESASKKDITEYSSWGKPSNTSSRIKYGIEYGLDLGTIAPLRTSININGAWFHIQRTRETESTSYVRKDFAYAPMMSSGSGSIQDRVNTAFRFITHIPEFKLIFTTTLQVVWYESYRSVYLDENGNPRAHEYSYQGRDYLAVEPIGYYNMDGDFTAWNAATMNNDPVLNVLVDRYNLYDFLPDIIEPWALLNIRLTKELGSWGQLSFTANNVTNTSRYHINQNSFSKTQLYPNMYFGAELKIKL